MTQKIARGVAEIALGRASIIELGNLEISRDWGYAPDFVNAMILTAELDKPGDFQVATGRLSSLEYLLEVAFSSAGISTWRDFVISNPQNSRPLDHAGLQGDFSSLNKATGWEPKVAFEEMIEEMVQHQMLKLQGKTTDQDWLERLKA